MTFYADPSFFMLLALAMAGAAFLGLREKPIDQRREARLRRQPLDRADYEVHGKGNRPCRAGRVGAGSRGCG